MRKYCFVPSCLTTSGNARGKIFITIPKPDEIRKRWLRAVGREDCTTKKLFFCQDHFDFENDMENFREYSIMGGRIYMKKDAVPHLMLGGNNGSPNIVMVEPDTLVLNENQLEPSMEAIDPLFLPIPLTSTVENKNVFPNKNTVGTSRSSSEITVRKYCFVPSCTNSTVNARHKLFVTLPRPEEIRKRWLQAVGREQSSPKGSVYFCQDHFNLENDMQNYIEHSLMGGRIFMKKNVVPHLMLEASNDNIVNPDIIMIEPETLISNDFQHDSSMEAIDPLLLSGPPTPPISVQQEPVVTNEFSNKNNSTTKRITTLLPTLTNSTSSTPKKSAPSKIHLTNNVNQLDRIDMNKTCRSCLLNTGNMISLKESYLTELSVAEVITSTTSIEISCDLDGLPTQICHDCFCKLHLSYKFVLKFRQSDQKLRTFLNKINKTKHVKKKPDPPNTSTQTDSISFANDVKLELYDLDSLSDHINSEQTNLEYPNDNVKAFHTIFEHNYGRTIDVNPISVNGLECDVAIKTENMSIRNEELSNGSPVYQSPSDELLEVNQLEGLNEINNKIDQDGTAQAEEGCSNRKGINHMGIRECHPTEATNNKDDHFKLGSKSFKFCSLQKRHKIRVNTPANEPVKRRFPCALCDVSFDQMGQLKCHRRIHKTDRSYACTYCARTFKYRASLKRHTQIHTGEKPYSCSVCRKTFAQRISLTYHMPKHTGEKSYACTVCTKRFTRKAGLTYHMRLHTGEKPYLCTLCDRSFSHRTSWVAHKKSHNR